MTNPLKPIWVFFSFLILTTPTFSQVGSIFYRGFFDVDPNNLTLNGVATIQPNGILCLTNDTSRLIGHAFHPSPLQFKNATAFSFSTAFVFAIVPEYPKLGGHGLAFTISPSKDLHGALPSQYLGLLNASDVGNFSNHILAVEFDTVQDFEFQDINDNHIGIDINSLQSNASASAAFFDDTGTKQNLNLKSGDRIQAWIDYDGAEKLLNMNGTAQSLDLSSLPSLPHPTKKNTAFIIAATSSAALLVLISVFAAIYLFRKIKNADVIEPWELEYGPHRFSYKELKIATKGFRDKELLGFGGFGRVYRGTLPKSKTHVAVKRVSHESKQGIREFVAEIASIGRLRHRNLVQLQGWCRRRGDLMLVYDFMCNGSLDKYLFDEPKATLSWNQRLKIVRGVAAGLLYLHEEWEQVVIHRDVKASNVLLDGEMNGRLGDFGLARLYEHGTTNPTTTRVVGTLGYLAPELTRTGKATTSSDVFAFGALLLEVVCGRRPIDPKAMPEEMVLVEWVWEKWREGRVVEVVDSRIRGDYRVEEVELVVKLGLMCSHPVASERPSMRELVRYLDGEEGGVPNSSINLPLDQEDQMGMIGMDDFVHSYPSSSMEKVEEEE
ncbi:hypothetical protein MRB53_019089 [Persea americana]|uniref:Uncharacterized protein n=1 Tax=Persea americana TaxID=3435 RepID=A0ACC2M9Q3_PERAE|nr:hypothetical protein MRB53_019089 [Persea americana]